MPKTLEEVVEIVQRYVGPNGAFVLMVDDGRHAEFRTGGSSVQIIGLNQIGGQFVEQMTFTKLSKNLTGADADLLKEG